VAGYTSLFFPGLVVSSENSKKHETSKLHAYNQRKKINESKPRKVFMIVKSIIIYKKILESGVTYS
jgi:lipid-binding SYLF domain-containing protein